VELNTAARGHGECPVCGRTLKLTKHGKVWTHGAKRPSVWPPATCSGSGEMPADTGGRTGSDH
jgi:hypothetical protein